MTGREFEKLVERGIERIPARFRVRLKNILFVVEKEPPEPGLLGLYEGKPLTERSISDPFALPDRITVYQGPHERLARDEEHLKKLVEETIWHEVAHYFGSDEERVQRAELLRDQQLRKRARRLRVV